MIAKHILYVKLAMSVSFVCRDRPQGRVADDAAAAAVNIQCRVDIQLEINYFAVRQKGFMCN